MTMEKRKNPYQRLLDDVKAFCSKVAHPHKVGMFSYPKGRLAEGWSLVDLNERVAAAKQLGYDVLLNSTDKGLEVFYVKERPETPYEWQY